MALGHFTINFALALKTNLRQAITRFEGWVKILGVRVVGTPPRARPVFPTFETLGGRRRGTLDVPMRDRRRACLSPRDEQERSRPLMPVRTYLGGYCTQNTRDGFGSRSAAFRPFRERSERRGPERVPGTFRTGEG